MVSDSDYHRVVKPGMAARTTGGIAAMAGLLVALVGVFKGNAVVGDADATATADLLLSLGGVLLVIGLVVFVVGVVVSRTATPVRSAPLVRSGPDPMDIARRPCSTCGERIAVTAKICRFCRADLV